MLAEVLEGPLRLRLPTPEPVDEDVDADRMNQSFGAFEQLDLSIVDLIY